MSSSVAGIPLIIEASLNGQTPRSVNPNVPYGDDEIVEQALACMEAGAAMIHNHTEEPIIGGSGCLDIENYAGAWRKLLALRPDAILTPTMPFAQDGVSVESRYSHIDAMAEEAIKRGGHVQVGLEPYVGPRTPTNVELVEEVVALAKKYDRPLATPAEAAEMLGLPTYPAGYGSGS